MTEKKEIVNFKYMCDRCLQTLDVDDEMYGIVIRDDLDNVKEFRGHESCMRDVGIDLGVIYDIKNEIDEDEEENE